MAGQSTGNGLFGGAGCVPKSGDTAPRSTDRKRGELASQQEPALDPKRGAIPGREACNKDNLQDRPTRRVLSQGASRGSDGAAVKRRSKIFSMHRNSGASKRNESSRKWRGSGNERSHSRCVLTRSSSQRRRSGNERSQSSTPSSSERCLRQRRGQANSSSGRPSQRGRSGNERSQSSTPSSSERCSRQWRGQTESSSGPSSQRRAWAMQAFVHEFRST
jgi:hypothetical protein